MSFRFNGRITKLEAVVSPPQRRKWWQICIKDGESSAEAIARHGIDPGPIDRVMLFRYGKCSSCGGKE